MSRLTTVSFPIDRGGPREYPIDIENTRQSSDSFRSARPYVRRFQPPLKTAAGVLSERRGWILREKGSGRDGWGEVAPFPGFETDPADWESKIRQWQKEGDLRILGEVGALGFGAWCLRQSVPFSVDVAAAGLLQGNSQGSSEVSPSPGSTCKVKIGMEEPRAERDRLERWLTECEGRVRLRLDANQSLSLEEAREWFAWMRPRREVEFLEQPFRVGQEKMLLETFGEDCARVALDESVVSPGNLEKALAMDWPGWIVIKPSLFGNPEKLFSLPEAVRRRIIVSSAFETGIGFSMVLQVAEKLGDFGLSHGLGTRGSFGEDNLDGWEAADRFRGEVSGDWLEDVASHAD